MRSKTEFYEEIRAFQDRLVQALRYKLAISGRHLLDSRIDRAATLMQRKIDGYWQRTDEVNFRIRQAIERRLRGAERRLSPMAAGDLFGPRRVRVRDTTPPDRRRGPDGGDEPVIEGEIVD